jgi:putative transcriptional regulator
VSSINLTHHFLIAMPNMADPYFARTLTYICEHNDQGALGIVVNRPIDMTLQALFERLSLNLKNNEMADAPIYFGGPVQTDRGFVLHLPAGDWQSTLKVSAGVRDGVNEFIGLTTSKDILEAVGRGEGPAKLMVSLGYAGWSAGQLEHELTQNAWLTVEAKDAIIFDLPAEERLSAALELLGLDYARLADQAGHA